MDDDDTNEIARKKFKEKEDSDEQIAWHTPLAPPDSVKGFPMPTFSTSVDRGLRDGRSDEVWDQVFYRNFCLHGTW